MKWPHTLLLHVPRSPTVATNESSEESQRGVFAPGPESRLPTTGGLAKAAKGDPLALPAAVIVDKGGGLPLPGPGPTPLLPVAPVSKQQAQIPGRDSLQW
jgi:hypothetical protein